MDHHARWRRSRIELTAEENALPGKLARWPKKKRRERNVQIRDHVLLTAGQRNRVNLPQRIPRQIGEFRSGVNVQAGRLAVGGLNESIETFEKEVVFRNNFHFGCRDIARNAIESTGDFNDGIRVEARGHLARIKIRRRRGIDRVLTAPGTLNHELVPCRIHTDHSGVEAINLRVCVVYGKALHIEGGSEVAGYVAVCVGLDGLPEVEIHEETDQITVGQHQRRLKGLCDRHRRHHRVDRVERGRGLRRVEILDYDRADRDIRRGIGAGRYILEIEQAAQAVQFGEVDCLRTVQKIHSRGAIGERDARDLHLNRHDAWKRGAVRADCKHATHLLAGLSARRTSTAATG